MRRNSRPTISFGKNPLGNGTGGVISLRPTNKEEDVNGAPYFHTTINNQAPQQGNIYVAAGSLILRVNEVDLAGSAHGVFIGDMKVGDSIIVGANTGTLVSPPSKNGSVWALSVDAWPPLPDGQYLVTTIIL